MNSTNRMIVKAMSVFGGVKALNILCSLVRNKLIAVWVGPAGVGLVILFNSVVDIVTTASRLNIDQSAMRDIARAGTTDIDLTSTVVSRWTLMLGMLAAIVMILLSPLISLWSFDDYSHWWIFCVLALVPLCTTVASGMTVLLQGRREFRRLALAGAVTALGGTVISIPLIYFLRLESIVWVITAYGVCTLVGALIYRLPYRRIKLNVREVWRRGAGFIRLGFMITLATLVTQILNYLFVLYLKNSESTSVLGLYQAGNTLINSYVGVLFTGIWVEYYPRLTAHIHSVRRTVITVSNQMAVTVWILMPVVAFFAAADTLIVRVLYADTFMDMLPFITIGIAGVVPRAVSWCMAHMMLARGDGMIYIVSETLSGVVALVLNITMFGAWGYAGLGVAYVVWFVFYTAVCVLICRKRYGLDFSAEAWKSAGIAMTFALVAVTGRIWLGWWFPLLMAAAVAPFSLKNLRS